MNHELSLMKTREQFMAIRVKMENKAIHVREKSGDLYLRFNQLKPNHYEKKHLLSNVFHVVILLA
ncbi:MAG: hypothetical protein IKH44_03985 [Bacteroidales bacterium]|nr:hypothetical protein [Bacteroidales bacterium]